MPDRIGIGGNANAVPNTAVNNTQTNNRSIASKLSNLRATLAEKFFGMFKPCGTSSTAQPRAIEATQMRTGAVLTNAAPGAVDRAMEGFEADAAKEKREHHDKVTSLMGDIVNESFGVLKSVDPSKSDTKLGSNVTQALDHARDFGVKFNLQKFQALTRAGTEFAVKLREVGPKKVSELDSFNTSNEFGGHREMRLESSVVELLESAQKVEEAAIALVDNINESTRSR